MKYAAILIILIGMMWKAYDFGVEHESARQAKAIKEAADTQAKKADAVYKEKIKIEVRYRDRIKTIYQSPDPTGCLDTTLGAGGLFNSTDN